MSFLPRLRPAMVAATVVLSGCVVPLGALNTTSQPGPGAAPAPAAAAPSLASTATTVELALNEERLLGAILKDGSGREPGVGTVLWQSTNPAVLSVHPTTGQAKGVAPGTTVVVATLVGSNARTQFEVKVVDKFTVRAITVEPANPVLAIGEKQALRATVAMADGTVSANVVWSSSDSTVAAVNPTNGEVSALKEGRVTIEATYALDTKFKGVANVTIVKNKGDAPTAPAPSSVVFGPDGGAGAPTGPAGLPGRFVAQAAGTTADLRAVDFLDAMTGFVGGDGGELLRTTTGGAGWEALSPGALAGQSIRGLRFTDVTTGLALTTSGLWKTEDGGTTWSAIDLAGATRFMRLEFRDAKIGYVLTDAQGGTYFRTNDGGGTWSKVTVPGVSQVIDVARTGNGDVVLGSDGVYLYDASLGGFDKRQAVTAFVDGRGQRSASLGSDGSTVWLAAGQDAYRSQDGGKTWTALGQAKGPGGLTISPGGGAREVLAFRTGEVAIVTSAGLHSTTDGQVWDHPDGVRTSLQDADFLDAYTGWLVGDAGTVFRYSAR